MQWLPLILLALVTIIFAARLLLSRMSGARFKIKSSLLSMPEQDLYRRLVAALPNHIILAQVAFSQMIEVTGGSRKENFRKRLTARQKVADFVVCDNTFGVTAVIELDDSSHDSKREKDQRRDEIVKEAGVPTVRWRVSKLPSPEDIRAAILVP